MERAVARKPERMSGRTNPAGACLPPIVGVVAVQSCVGARTISTEPETGEMSVAAPSLCSYSPFPCWQENPCCCFSSSVPLYLS